MKVMSQNRPVLSAMTPATERRTVAEKFTNTGDDADGGGAGPERAEVWPVDAAAALVGQVGKKVHRPHHQDEGEGGGCAAC